MADATSSDLNEQMLDSQVIRIDPEILVPDQDRSPSGFEKILREMLAVYVASKTKMKMNHADLYHRL